MHRNMLSVFASWPEMADMWESWNSEQTPTPKETTHTGRPRMAIQRFGSQLTGSRYRLVQPDQLSNEGDFGMSETRTIEWASVAGWVSENEQQIRDVMKFEGLKGAMVEVLRLAPDQPELAALREELATMTRELEAGQQNWVDGMQRLADAERRNSDMAEMLGEVIQWFDDGVCRSDAEFEFLSGIRGFLAALNPKPEAANHDE